MRNKHAISEVFLYPAAKGVGFFIRALPVRISLWFAGLIGSAAYHLYGKRRSIGYANIKAAFAKRFPPSQIKAINKDVFRHFTGVLFELFRFPDIDEGYIDRYVPCEGLGFIAEVLKKGRGAVILTAHFGNWELSGLAGAIKGFPQDVLARQQKYLRLDRLLNSYRERYGRRVITKGVATRQIISSLKANRVVAILSDQDGGMQGCLVNFFGRLASTPKGAAAFALKYDSVIIPNFCVRQNGPFYRMILERGIKTEGTADTEEDIRSALQRFTGLLESYITRYPGQWLWLHKRWKTTPSRRVLLLSDGKAGHINQSKAAANQIRKAVFEKAQKDIRVQALKKDVGLDGLIYQEKTVEVRYKSRLHKAFLTFCSLFASSRCQGCLRCLRFCLQKDSYKELSAAYADIIISCGSSGAPVNHFLCKENNARGISIAKPGPLPLSRFALCIMPRHDNPRPAGNILITQGALNLTQETAAGDSIGLLIGGDNKSFVMSGQDIEKVLDAVVNISKKMRMPVLATTSRRTSVGIEDIIKARLGAFDDCRMLVIANQDNPPGTVEKILASSSTIIVSGESVSMVSEAASSGKRVLVFLPRARRRDSLAWPWQARHVRFLKNLEGGGFIILCRPQDIESAFYDKRPLRRLDDNSLVYEAVKRII